MAAVKRVLGVGALDSHNQGGSHIVLAVAADEYVNARAYFDWYLGTAQKSRCTYVFGNGAHLKRGSALIFPTQLHGEPGVHSRCCSPFGFSCSQRICQADSQSVCVDRLLKIVRSTEALAEGLVS